MPIATFCLLRNFLSLFALLTIFQSAHAQHPGEATGRNSTVQKTVPAPAAETPAQPTHTLELAPQAGAGAAGVTGDIQFIGTATVLIRYGGMTILTDPNFLHKGDHAHLGYGLTSERLTAPAISLEQLPPIDFILLSHFHGDHFDQLVQEKMSKTVPIVTIEEAVPELRKHGFSNLYPLAHWESMLITKGAAKLQITAMPGRHAPGALSGMLPLVMGSMLDFSMNGASGKYRMYISGDTLIYDAIREIPRRYPDVDLALLHLGGTRILGMLKVTMDGKDGAEMLQIIAPKEAIPIHYNDYTVFKSPLSDFEKEVGNAKLNTKVIYLKHGDHYQFLPAKP